MVILTSYLLSVASSGKTLDEPLRQDHRWKPSSGIKFSPNQNGSKSRTWQPVNNIVLGRNPTDPPKLVKANTSPSSSHLGIRRCSASVMDSVTGSSNLSPWDSQVAHDEVISCSKNEATDLESPKTVKTENGSGTGQPPSQPFSQTSEHAPLTYQIPPEVLENALKAPTRSRASYWCYDMYRNPNDDRVELQYCLSRESAEEACQYFIGQPVLGFDMEWDSRCLSGFKNNVSLIQLACEDRILLIHVALFEEDEIGDPFLPTLKSILESRDVIKTGVHIKSDCTRLRNHTGIDAKGLIELSNLYKLVKFSENNPLSINKILVNLAAQVQDHLLLPLLKDSVRTSNWMKKLSPEQLTYAATDAYAGFRLYHVLEEKRKSLQPMPQRPAYAELGLPIKVLYENAAANSRRNSPSRDSSINHSTAQKDVEESSSSSSIDELEVGESETLSPSCDASDTEHAEASGKQTAKARRELANKMKALTLSQPEIEEADAWIVQWRASRPASVASRTPNSCLRAYALWHTQSIDLAQVASLLRDPPLQLSTVSGYVAECVWVEKLPFEESRLQEVIKLLPRVLVLGRFKYFIRRYRRRSRD